MWRARQRLTASCAYSGQPASHFWFCMDGDSSAKVFISAGDELADLDEKTPREAKSFCRGFARLIPLMIFAFAALWRGLPLQHSEDPQACFIIDDPLLKNRYGFLEYSKTAGNSHGATEVCRFHCFPFPGIIGDRAGMVAGLFAAARSTLSLCVHGWPTTPGEKFLRTRIFALLCGKAQSALNRMKIHLRLSGRGSVRRRYGVSARAFLS